jgi:hypothetical protein
VRDIVAAKNPAAGDVTTKAKRACEKEPSCASCGKAGSERNRRLSRGSAELKSKRSRGRSRVRRLVTIEIMTGTVMTMKIRTGTVTTTEIMTMRIVTRTVMAIEIMMIRIVTGTGMAMKIVMIGMWRERL